MNARCVVILLFLACIAGCDSPEGNFNVPADAHEPRLEDPCADRNPLRNAYFGDLHVHTAFSSDAWMFDVKLTPDDAYAYAFGQPVTLSPGDRPTQIDRPLDFAGVTDHAEFLGEMVVCQDPSAPGYNGDFCQAFREGNGRSPALISKIMSPFPWRDDEACGDDGERCAAASQSLWQRTIEAAERWNDRTSGCERTTFVAYEYSSFRMGSNLHRNVVFKNEVVPTQPVSYLDAHREWELWEMLDRGCKSTDTGCDVLAIPHNSNISNGRMFDLNYPGAWGKEAQAARAKLRMDMEPIIEVFQHKGDSECRNGVPGVLESEDELCNFEKYENYAFERIEGTTEPGACYAGPGADNWPHLGPNCVSKLSYARYALTEGLAEEARIGVNPFKFGLSASTDTHNALAGGVQERGFPGHLGRGDETPSQRTSYDGEIPGNANNNPGGLIGVWAEENDRAAIFEAMQRKEVFGTSGPRILPRLFAGYDLPGDLCDRDDAIAVADAQGVPMGGDLSPAAGRAPAFLAYAMADAGTAAFPGNPLQRLQIIKGWVDEAGDRHQKVYEVAGDPDNGATVDLETCRPEGAGFEQLCSVWSDPDFDASTRAVYYMRAVENPSCRYDAWQCLQLDGDDRPEGCDDPKRPKVIQERAWSSPIWYSPAD